jgi:filamentous hemagglutinin family protein
MARLDNIASKKRTRWPLVTSLAALAVVFAEPALALPTGPTVTQGKATISASAQNLSIQQLTQQAIVKWNGFSIGPLETVRFLQPNSQSVILNRVVGADPSLIQGQLNSNGQVFLINPNGILFGPHSVVDTGSFMASTLSLTDADFMAGRYRFVQGDASKLTALVNQGTIKAAPGGFVVLTSPLISNQGLIIAQQGQVALGASKRATINFDNQGLLSIVIPSTSDKAGTVLLTPDQASSILSKVISNPNIVEAGSLGPQTARGGEGLLVNSGSIVTDGSTGHAAGSVVLDSSHATALTSGSLVSANGDGANAGSIRVLSGANTYADGQVEVHASGDSGNAGSVEISGHNVQLLTPVDLHAAHGKAGSLLLDPTNITVVNGTGTGNGTGDGDQTVSVQTLDAMAGTVTLQASNNVNSGANVPSIVLQPGTTFNVQAGGQINFANTTFIQAGSGINFSAMGPITFNEVAVQNGPVSLQSSGSTVNGYYVSQATDVAISAPLGIQLTYLNASGTANLVSSAGPITGTTMIAGSLTANGANGVSIGTVNTAGPIVLNSTLGMVMSNSTLVGSSISLNGVGGVNANLVNASSGPVDLESSAGTATALRIQGGTVTVNGAQGIAFNLINASGDVAASSSNGPILGTDTNAQAGLIRGNNVTLQAASNVTLQTVNANGALTLNSTAGAVSATALTGTDINVFGQNGVTVQGIAASGDASLASQQSINLGIVSAAGSLTLKAISGNLTTGQINFATTPGGDVALTSGGTLTSALVYSLGNVSLLSRGDLSVSGIGASGAVSVSSQLGSVSVPQGIVDLVNPGPSGVNRATSNVGPSGAISVSAPQGSLTLGSVQGGSSITESARDNLSAVNAISNGPVALTSSTGTVSSSGLLSGSSVAISAPAGVSANQVNSTGTVEIDSANGSVSTTFVSAPTVTINARQNIVSTGNANQTQIQGTGSTANVSLSGANIFGPGNTPLRVAYDTPSAATNLTINASGNNVTTPTSQAAGGVSVNNFYGVASLTHPNGNLDLTFNGLAAPTPNSSTPQFYDGSTNSLDGGGANGNGGTARVSSAADLNPTLHNAGTIGTSQDNVALGTLNAYVWSAGQQSLGMLVANNPGLTSSQVLSPFSPTLEFAVAQTRGASEADYQVFDPNLQDINFWRRWLQNILIWEDPEQ